MLHRLVILNIIIWPSLWPQIRKPRQPSLIWIVSNSSIVCTSFLNHYYFTATGAYLFDYLFLSQYKTITEKLVQHFGAHANQHVGLHTLDLLQVFFLRTVFTAVGQSQTATSQKKRNVCLGSIFILATGLGCMLLHICMYIVHVHTHLYICIWICDMCVRLVALCTYLCVQAPTMTN